MRPIRRTLVALALAAAALGVTSLVPPARAALPLPPDTLGVLTPWMLVPPAPCDGDSLTLVVRGFKATPCVEFVGADLVPNGGVRITTRVFDGRMCLLPPTQFFPVPVPLGRFAAGSHALDIELLTVHVRSDGTTISESQHQWFDFQVSRDCPPPPPTTGLPYVDAIFTEPPVPCDGQPTSLVLAGVFRDGCGRVVDSRVDGPDHVELTLKPQVGPDTACALVLVPWKQAFDLGVLPAGAHHTGITLQVIQWDTAGQTFVRHTYEGALDFFVRAGCEPPPPGPLPYVTSIFVGVPGPCGPRPPCPKDSIVVRVAGAFPSDCFRFRRIELIPSPIVGPMPEPPVVRIIVDDGGCLGRPCINVPVPWSAAVRLPPLPARDYHLGVELAQVSCSDTYPPGQLFRTEVPFTVVPDCGPACLIAGFTPPHGNFAACNAAVSPGHPAELTLVVRPTVALAGLQGALRLEPAALKVTKLEAVGPAAGMTLDWTTAPDGARFVLFAPHGAPIPALPSFPDPTTASDPIAWPVLRVTVEQPPDVIAPEATVVGTAELLGADIDGRGVSLCPPPLCPMRDPTIPVPSGWPIDPWFPSGRAVICAEAECDFNADGHQDVRDLVSMVHCLYGEGPCPPDAATRFDCDADQAFTIADVICCARHVLSRPSCPDCPQDSVRPEHGVAVRFGAPVETAAGVELPLHIDGADRLGAATLTLAAPLDRYDLAGAEVVGSGRWMALTETRDGQIVLGLLCTSSGDLRADPNLDLRLRFSLRPGETPGGQVSAVAGEFSGGDGVLLGVDLGAPTQGLPGPAELALGANRPNPFSSETRFTLELTQAAEVSVGVYDLRGRAVAILFGGVLPPGPREFRWDGRRADGSAAPEGVYFYRASVAGRTLSRKLILMRSN